MGRVFNTTGVVIRLIAINCEQRYGTCKLEALTEYVLIW